MMKNSCRAIAVGLLIAALSGCAKMGNIVNPFYESDDPITETGEKSLKPLLDEGEGGGTSADQARAALEAMSSYRRAQAPQPYYPVMNPAEVRLMWIPDHLNKHNDLVPAHYYYLLVKPEGWAVQDAFDMESQLEVEGKGSKGGSTPWVYSDTKR